MLSETGIISSTQHKRLLAIGGPVRLVVERTRVPHDLKMDLRDLNGVRRRTLASDNGERCRTASRVRNVRLVVRTVEILAIPTAEKMVSRPFYVLEK